MNKIALSAIAATLVSIAVFQVITLANVDVGAVVISPNAIVINIIAAVVIGASAIIGGTSFFTAVVIAFATAAVFAVASAFTIPTNSDVMAAAKASASTAALALVITAIMGAVHTIQGLKIPYQWVFGIFMVEVASIAGSFLVVDPLQCVGLAIVGCGLIAGIWWMYNRKHPPLPIPANS